MDAGLGRGSECGAGLWDCGELLREFPHTLYAPPMSQGLNEETRTFILRNDRKRRLENPRLPQLARWGRSQQVGSPSPAW